jgi:hypothetical protein
MGALDLIDGRSHPEQEAEDYESKSEIEEHHGAIPSS